MLSDFLSKHSSNKVYLQPRMGLKDINDMSDAISKLSHNFDNVVGTLTLDSFTRQYDHEKVREAINKNGDLNGFPIMHYDSKEIHQKITSLQSEDFLIQVRHGMSLPYEMVQKMIDCGLTITEGGPISYCLPYSRTPLDESIASWKKTAQLIAVSKGHLESFAGCMMGQLSPPSLLIALSILEGLFLIDNGITDLSLSFAQGYSPVQDFAAVEALKKLADAYLHNANFHIVIYAFMGIYPETEKGHERIVLDSCRLTHQSGARRLIYKTKHESSRIPTPEENISEINRLNERLSSGKLRKIELNAQEYDQMLSEAKQIIDDVLNLDDDISQSILIAFEKGILDIPYCLHPNNKGLARSWIDEDGYVQWYHPRYHKYVRAPCEQNSTSFMQSLNYNRIQYDRIE